MANFWRNIGSIAASSLKGIIRNFTIDKGDDTNLIPDMKKARKIADAHCAAWTSRSPDCVARRYSTTTSMVMNGGEPMTTRAEIAEMAGGFMAEFPDLKLVCGSVLAANHHMVYTWTFTGTHIRTGNSVAFSGWEEWDLNDNLEVTRSLGWYDAEDYEQQVGE
jgi:SnoaL-like domain